MFKYILSSLLLIEAISCGVQRGKIPRVSAPSSSRQVQEYSELHGLLSTLETTSQHSGSPYLLSYNQEFWFGNMSRCEQLGDKETARVFRSYLRRIMAELDIEHDESTVESFKQIPAILPSTTTYNVCEDQRTNGQHTTKNFYIMASDNSLRLMVTKTK
ncbi:MAG: hypothetical protein AB7T49_13345 [Oligoflexales bacterium]